MDSKFKQLVHFLIDHGDHLGATKLNKALWYTDVVAYQNKGHSVTGETYIKRQYGPVPKTILRTLDELVAEGKINIEQPKHQFELQKHISLKTPLTPDLLAEDIDLAIRVSDVLLPKTASEISELTHDDIWQIAENGEEIPLCATLATEVGEYTDEAFRWANHVVLGIENRAGI